MAALNRLQLIQFRAGYNLPLHAAREHGVFAKHGLEVDVAYTPGSDYLIEALKAGKFEIGHPAADDVVGAFERDPNTDLFLFMGLHSGLLSLLAAPPYPDIESLRGKTFGVDSRATGFVFLLEKLLRSNGFGPEEYRLIEIGGWEFRYRALLEGTFAATLLTPPFVGQAVERGCHILARGDQILPVYQATGGAAKRSWAEKNRELLVSYIRAYVEATRWCYEANHRVQCLELLGKHNDLKGRAVEDTLDALLDSGYGIYPGAELNVPGLAAVLELRAEMGYLGRPPASIEKYMDLSFYRQALGVRR